MKTVVLHLINVEQIKPCKRKIYLYIDKSRRQNVDAYKCEDDKLRSLGAGYLLKKYLPHTKIKISSDRKPYIYDGPFFNLSHSGRYALLAIDQEREIGVDIERINPERSAFIAQMNPEYADDPEAVFRIWSNKESLTKCRGTGIKEIRDTDGLPLEGVRTFKEKTYYTRSLIYQGYAISVTLEGEEPFDIKIEEVKI